MVSCSAYVIIHKEQTFFICVVFPRWENVSDKINSIMLDYKYSSWPLIQGSCLEYETGGEIIEEVATVVVRYGAWPKPWMFKLSLRVS